MLKVIENRFSPREYLEKDVEQENIDEVIKAGLLAPSGKNMQEGIIIQVSNKKVRDELSKVNASVMNGTNDPFYGAPVVLIVAHKVSAFAELNGAAMIENMLLEAENQGLGARWINRAKESLKTEFGKKLLEGLGLDPDLYVGVGNVILGYSNQENPNHGIKENRVFYIK